MGRQSERRLQDEESPEVCVLVVCTCGDVLRRFCLQRQLHTCSLLAEVHCLMLQR